jgi:hypothetical protein
MAVAMMYCWGRKNLTQDLFLQLSVDRSNSPTAVMLHSRPCGVGCGILVFALIPPVIW